MANWAELRVLRGIDIKPEWVNLGAACNIHQTPDDPDYTDIIFGGYSIRVLHKIEELKSLLRGQFSA